MKKLGRGHLPYLNKEQMIIRSLVIHKSFQNASSLYQALNRDLVSGTGNSVWFPVPLESFGILTSFLKCSSVSLCGSFLLWGRNEEGLAFLRGKNNCEKMKKKSSFHFISFWGGTWRIDLKVVVVTIGYIMLMIRKQKW